MFVAEKSKNVPEDTSLLSQLITFKKEKKRIGCVVDEYGETKGILTLDDILEEIVGEYSSLDQKNQLITDISHNKIEVHGSIQLRDINKRLGVNLPDSLNEDRIFQPSMSGSITSSTINS